MDSQLQLLLARARAEELHRAAGSARRRGRAGPPPELPPASPVTLRFAFPDDEAALARLAALDSSEPPAAPVLLAEVSGELRAALSLADGAIVADPFRPAVALIELLEARARQLTATERSRRPWRVWGAARLRSRARA
jgi:hypothetical protein